MTIASVARLTAPAGRAPEAVRQTTDRGDLGRGRGGHDTETECVRGVVEGFGTVYLRKRRIVQFRAVDVQEEVDRDLRPCS